MNVRDVFNMKYQTFPHFRLFRHQQTRNSMMGHKRRIGFRTGIERVLEIKTTVGQETSRTFLAPLPITECGVELNKCPVSLGVFIPQIRKYSQPSIMDTATWRAEYSNQ